MKISENILLKTIDLLEFVEAKAKSIIIACNKIKTKNVYLILSALSLELAVMWMQKTNAQTDFNGTDEKLTIAYIPGKYIRRDEYSVKKIGDEVIKTRKKDIPKFQNLKIKLKGINTRNKKKKILQHLDELINLWARMIVDTDNKKTQLINSKLIAYRNLIEAKMWLNKSINTTNKKFKL